MFIVRVCLAQRLKGNNEVVELNLPVILCSSLRKSDIYIFSITLAKIIGKDSLRKAWGFKMVKLSEKQASYSVTIAAKN